MNPHISIVSPVYRGEKMVAELVRRNVESVTSITDDYEIILVNDASPDNSWDEIVKQCALNPKVKGINLSRNFGQHYAITAGLHYAKGDWVVVMDCDLQDRPEEIPNLYKKAQEGYDIVYARRVVKHVGWWKRFSSVAFHTVFDWLSGVKTDSTIANYGVFHRKVIVEYNKIPQQARSFGSIVGLLGFKIGYVDVEQDESARGCSSYTLRKLLKHSFDIIVSSTNKPLRMAVGLGFGMATISFLLALYNLIAKLLGIISVSGYTTTVFSIWFVGGLLLFVMGVLGLYVGKIFDQVKGHPLYVVRDVVNVDNDNNERI
jgi:dolichol-phosphate mannosyltransferase